MPCPDVVERLPELLNGTLAAEEADRVRRHLASCAECKDEWDETRLGAALMGSHPPTAVIVALAWDQASVDFDLELARQHIAGCPDCADELALARASRTGETERVRPLVRKASWALPAAWAAAAAFVAFGLGVSWEAARARQRLTTAEARTREVTQRQSVAESAVESLRQAESELRARLDRLTSPQLNLPILELLPGPGRGRPATSSENVIIVRPEDPFVVLVVSAPPLGPPSNAELRNGKGAIVWRGTGLRPSSIGGYTLGIPTALLTDGPFRLVLSTADARAPFASLPFSIRRPR